LNAGSDEMPASTVGARSPTRRAPSVDQQGAVVVTTAITPCRSTSTRVHLNEVVLPCERDGPRPRRALRAVGNPRGLGERSAADVPQQANLVHRSLIAREGRFRCRPSLRPPQSPAGPDRPGEMRTRARKLMEHNDAAADVAFEKAGSPRSSTTPRRFPCGAGRWWRTSSRGRRDAARADRRVRSRLRCSSSRASSCRTSTTGPSVWWQICSGRTQPSTSASRFRWTRSRTCPVSVAEEVQRLGHEQVVVLEDAAVA
jgi:hypothetical protein